MKTLFFTKIRGIAGVALVWVLLSFSTTAQAAAIKAATNGNWSNASTWMPAQIPTALDDVTIDNGFTVTVASTGAICASIQLGTKNIGSGTLTFSGTSDLTVSGTVTVGDKNSGSTTDNGTINMASGATFSIGTLASGSNSTATDNFNAGTIIYTGSTGFVVPTDATIYNNLIINSATYTITAAKNTAINGTLTLSSGTYIAGTKVTMSPGSAILVSGGTMTGNLPGNNSYTVTYIGNASATGTGGELSGGAPSVFLNLNSGQILNLNASAVLVNLTINPGNTLSMYDKYKLTVSGNLTCNGTLITDAANVITGAGTMGGSGTIYVTATGNSNDFTSQYTITNKILNNLTLNFAGTDDQVLGSTISPKGFVISNSGNIVYFNANETTHAGGTVVDANATLEVVAAYTLSGALSGSGTVDVTHSGDPNNDITAQYIGAPLTLTNLTLNFDGAGSQNVNTAISPLGIVISNTGGVVTFNANVIPGLGGTTVNSGATIKLGATNTLSGAVSGTGSITVTAGGVTDNLKAQYTGTPNLATLKVIFSGNRVQSIGGGTYTSLTENNGSSITLLGDVTLSGNLTLTSGNVVLGNHTLTVSSTSGGSASSYVLCNNTSGGSGSGALIIKNVSTTTVFPIGCQTGDYTPATIDNSAGTIQDFSALVFDGVLQDGTSGGQNASYVNAVNKTWLIHNLGSNPSATLTLQWNTSDEKGAFNRNAAYISHYTTSWDVPAPSAASGNNPYTLSRSGLTSFSPFAIGDTLAPLPIKLVSFNATLANKAVTLTWTTASEINNNYFTIQRSADGIHFDDIMTQPGAGNSEVLTNYSAVDAQPLPGTSYYRLKQTDYNGASETFNIVSVNNNVSQGDFSILSASPTMFNNQFTLNYKTPANGEVRIVVTNMMGTVVADVTTSANAGYNSYIVNNTEIWKSGIYTVQMYYNNWVNFVKVEKAN